MFDNKAYMKKYHQDHEAEDKQYRAEHKVEIAKRNKKWRADHPEYDKEHRVEKAEYGKKYRQRLKHEVLTHYSLNGYLSCGCCSETDLAKLCIDHMRAGGGAHRKSLKRFGDKFYLWLKQQNYPEGYQTLCLDCNNLKKRWDDENWR